MESVWLSYLMNGQLALVLVMTLMHFASDRDAFKQTVSADAILMLSCPLNAVGSFPNNAARWITSRAL